MSRRTQVYVGDKVKGPADQCLKARLYVSGWELSNELLRFRDNTKPEYKLAVLREGGKPIALSLYNGNQVMAFCRKDQRRNGYASRCVRALNINHSLPGVEGRTPWAMIGIDESEPFWAKNKVRTSWHW